MIFVTVGTHEQPFNRLMEAVDHLNVDEEIIVQYGYSNYRFENPNIKAQPFFGNDLMTRYSEEARVVVTHGGPGSIFTALIYGKKPIVVPRQRVFGEHVNDHQVAFAKHMKEEGMIEVVLDISDLAKFIKDPSGEGVKYRPKTDLFVSKLKMEIEALFNEDRD